MGISGDGGKKAEGYPWGVWGVGRQLGAGDGMGMRRDTDTPEVRRSRKWETPKSGMLRDEDNVGTATRCPQAGPLRAVRASYRLRRCPAPPAAPPYPRTPLPEFLSLSREPRGTDRTAHSRRRGGRSFRRSLPAAPRNPPRTQIPVPRSRFPTYRAGPVTTGTELRAESSGPAVNGAAMPQSYVTGGAGPAGGTR